MFSASMSQTTTGGRLPTTRSTAPSSWKASRHLTPLPRPPVDPEIDAPPKIGPDGRIIKKVRPRRTIDLWAGVGRWEMVILEIYAFCTSPNEYEFRSKRLNLWGRVFRF